MEYTHICTNIEDLNNIPIVNGQIIFVLDTQQIYVDYNNLRNNVTVGSVSYYQSLKEKMKYSAQKEYSVGDICYYYNSFVAGSQPGWYIRSEEGVTPGIWNSNYWTELFDINIDREAVIISGYDFGEDNLSFGESSITIGKQNFINGSKFSLVGGYNNVLNEDSSKSLLIFGQNNIVDVPSESSFVLGQNNRVSKINNTDYFDTSVSYFMEGKNNNIESYGECTHIEGNNNYIKNIKNCHIEGNYNIIETSTDDLKDPYDSTIAFQPPLNIHIEGGGENNGNYCKLNREFDNNIHIEGTNNRIENLTESGVYGAHNIHLEGDNNILKYDTENIENVNIYGKDNVIQLKNNGINQNVIIAGEKNAVIQEKHSNVEGTSWVQNLFMFGVGLSFSESGKDNHIHSIFGTYNDENLKTDYIFSVGTGDEEERKTSFGIGVENIYFNNEVYFGQYNLLEPMETLMTQFSDETKLDKYSQKSFDSAWYGHYNTKGTLIYNRDFDKFNEYLVEKPISWTSNIGSIAPLLWFTIEYHKEIDNIDTKIGSMLLQCRWSKEKTSLSLTMCKYQTCIRVQEVLLPEFIPAHWDDYSGWIEPDTIVTLHQNSNEQVSLTYDPIVEVEISNKDYVNNTFSLTLKLHPKNPVDTELYSTVQILNIQLPNGVTPDEIDNTISLWSAGSPDYEITWYDKDEICNGDYHNWPFVKNLQTKELLAPRADVFYERGSLVMFNGVLYESQGARGGLVWFDNSLLPTEYKDYWQTAFNRGKAWHKVINPPSEYERGRYYPAGDICIYTVTDIRLGDYTEYYLCNESYYADTNPDNLDPFPPENAYWTCISNNLELAQLDARITALENG